MPKQVDVPTKIPTDEFCADAWQKSSFRDRRWYMTHLMKTLEDQKEKQVRDIDVSIRIAQELLKKLSEKCPEPIVVPLRELIPSEDDSLMKPIEPEVLDILYGSSEKGGDERYLKARNKKAPEDKYFFRITSSWDYGWQQKQSRLRGRDVNRGRCAILRDTFYRKNNLAPDPPYYAQPSGAEVSICSEYSCNFSEYLL